jgi:hypothetical protein
MIIHVNMLFHHWRSCEQALTSTGAKHSRSWPSFVRLHCSFAPTKCHHAEGRRSVRSASSSSLMASLSRRNSATQLASHHALYTRTQDEEDMPHATKKCDHCPSIHGICTDEIVSTRTMADHLRKYESLYVLQATEDRVSFMLRRQIHPHSSAHADDRRSLP